MMPRIRAAVRSWTAAGGAPGDPQNLTLRAGDDLQVHPVAAVLAGVERPVSGDPVDEDEGAVDHYERVPGLLRRRQRAAQLRGAGGQQGYGLARVPPGRGGAHREPGGQVRECLAFAQVNQDQQGLPAGVQLAPARADLRPVAANHPGHIGQGLGRQRQRSTVEKYRGPWARDEDRGDRAIYQGLRPNLAAGLRSPGGRTGRYWRS
jgi:hypothetical protein